jgi:hypothetical protein
MAPKMINQHTSSCVLWLERFGSPWPYFKFSAVPAMYKADQVEGVDFIRCCECYQHGWDFRFSRLVQHIKVHGHTEASYLEKYPGKSIRLDSTLAKRIETVKSTYGVSNVSQSEKVKAKIKKSMFDKYGETSSMRVESCREKAKQTNLDRYGAENPFASEQIKEKIRQTNLDRYGVENPNQCPEVVERRLKTNTERYGVEHYFLAEEFKGKFCETSRRNFGADHPMQSEKGRALLSDALERLHGQRVTTPFAIDSIQAKAQASSIANHGGKHHLSHPDIIEARKQTLLAKYGVDNISKVPEIKEKIIRMIKERFRDGAIPKMTHPERVVQSLVPERVVFSGDWSYWITWQGGRHKNPDFVVLTPEQFKAYQMGVPLNDLRTSLVIEVNGDFWHTDYIGMTREAREAEFVAGYASVGVTCLVLWGSDIDAHPEDICAQVQTLTGKY